VPAAFSKRRTKDGISLLARVVLFITQRERLLEQKVPIPRIEAESYLKMNSLLIKFEICFENGACAASFL
jgi:hypothetical protein